MIMQEERHRLLVEHIESEMFNSLSQFKPLIEKILQKGTITNAAETELTMAVLRYFLVRHAQTGCEDNFLFDVEETLRGPFLQCEESPGSELCMTCLKECPFRSDPDTDLDLIIEE